MARRLLWGEGMVVSMRLASCVLLATAAACGPGDRALGDECPAGETCSDQTPEGLAFRGPRFSGSFFDVGGVHPTAVGGVQTITIEDLATHKPLTVPWHADVTGALIAERQDAGHVVVKGVADGESKLRIVDPETGELHDRHSIVARPVSSIRLTAGRELIPSTSPVVWFAGATVDAVVWVSGSDGERLVDENLAVAPPAPGTMTISRESWDHIVVSGAPAENLALTITAGSLLDERVVARVVDAVDDIGLTASVVLDREHRVRLPEMVCVEAHREGAIVLGLPWTFITEGPAVAQTSRIGNCFYFTPQAEGRLTVSATAAGKTRSVVLDILPAAPRVRGAGAERPITNDLGERAHAAR